MAKFNWGDLRHPTMSIYDEIGLGHLTRTVAGTKFGRSESVGTTLELISDLGGNYTYFTTATAVNISSSSASDTDQTISITGLDANWEVQTQTVSLAGQTETAVTGTWMRIYRVFAATGSDLLGDIYVYEDDTVTAGVPQTASNIKAKILIGNGQTEMAQLTVPAGNTMIVKDILFTSGKDNNMQFQARIRPTDSLGPWRVIFNHDVYRSIIQFHPTVPWIIPEKYDVEVRAAGGTGTSEAACAWTYICVPS